LVILGAIPSGAQAVQAVKGVGGEVKIATTGVSNDSILIAIASRRAVYQGLGSTAQSVGNAEVVEIARDAEAAASEVLRSRNDADRFTAAIAAFNTAEARVARLTRRTEGTRTPTSVLGTQFDVLNIPVPAVHTLVPNVVFVLGFDMTKLPSEASDDWVTSFGVTTNLIGALVGTAFDAAGSNALKDYFTNNISAGPAIPTRGHHKLTSQLGFGLGGVTIGRFTVWPAINIDQRDSADSRVPRKLVSLKPTESSWSSPSVGIAVPLGSADVIVRRIKAGRIVPIFTVGYLLPYYFPGDNFTALGALFTSKRSDYEKSGAGRLSLGISMPLLKVQAPPAEKQQ
jgi:hypothetical protein